MEEKQENCSVLWSIITGVVILLYVIARYAFTFLFIRAACLSAVKDFLEEEEANAKKRYEAAEQAEE